MPRFIAGADVVDRFEQRLAHFDDRAVGDAGVFAAAIVDRAFAFPMPFGLGPEKFASW